MVLEVAAGASVLPFQAKTQISPNREGTVYGFEAVRMWSSKVKSEMPSSRTGEHGHCSVYGHCSDISHAAQG